MHRVEKDKEVRKTEISAEMRKLIKHVGCNVRNVEKEKELEMAKIAKDEIKDMEQITKEGRYNVAKFASGKEVRLAEISAGVHKTIKGERWDVGNIDKEED
ncbi:hypothetical protein BGZ82_009504 [Podila clonocystis]|nr:hypothetical protein BGZ82_009504 [Podila clonocystis]